MARPSSARPSEKAAAGDEQTGKSSASNGAWHLKRRCAGRHGKGIAKSNLAYVPQPDITEDADTKDKLASDACEGKEVLPASAEGQIKVEEITELVASDDSRRTISRGVKVEDGLCSGKAGDRCYQIVGWT